MKNILIKYKEISLEIMEVLKRDTIEDLEDLFNKRSMLLQMLAESNVSKNDVSTILNELEINKLDSEIKDAIMQAQYDVKAEIDKLKKEESANNLYGKQFENIYFLNKKI